jgi:hypothetical protein
MFMDRKSDMMRKEEEEKGELEVQAEVQDRLRK